MAFNLEEVTQKLLTHPYFEKAKHVKELGPAHPEDSVFVHLTQTADVIREKVNGDFIKNPDAKKLFLEFMNRDIDGNTFRDIAIITGLIHDIAKIMSYKEEGKVWPINQLKPGTQSSRSINHGYYGSLIIPQMLKEIGLSEKVIHYITNIVRLHLVIFDYYAKSADFNITDRINDLKPLMEGYHVEVALNAIGDIDGNPPLEPCKQLLYQMFEEPHFYSQREYFIA